MEMILEFRSEQTNIIVHWKGQDVYFSENLPIQQMWVEDDHLVLQVGHPFDVQDQPDGSIAVVTYGESAPEKPSRFLPLGMRLGNRS